LFGARQREAAREFHFGENAATHEGCRDKRSEKPDRPPARPVDGPPRGQATRIEGRGSTRHVSTFLH
jgi:hypothetical protein